MIIESFRIYKEFIRSNFPVLHVPLTKIRFFHLFLFSVTGSAIPTASDSLTNLILVTLTTLFGFLKMPQNRLKFNMSTRWEFLQRMKKRRVVANKNQARIFELRGKPRKDRSYI